MFTLTIVFDRQKQHVLMCWHKKQKAYNFLGGKINECEDELKASYRELKEETGITEDDIDLKFIRHERATVLGNTWTLYVTAGVLNKEVTLEEEANKLVWIDINDYETICNHSMGNGNCLVFMREAMISLFELEKRINNWSDNI